MSHDATAVRSVREASRRRVSFQTSMEDLEGRVLLSGVHHYKPPRVHVQVRWWCIARCRTRGFRAGFE